MNDPLPMQIERKRFRKNLRRALQYMDQAIDPRERLRIGDRVEIVPNNATLAISYSGRKGRQEVGRQGKTILTALLIQVLIILIDGAVGGG